MSKNDKHSFFTLFPANKAVCLDWISGVGKTSRGFSMNHKYHSDWLIGIFFPFAYLIIGTFLVSLTLLSVYNFASGGMTAQPCAGVKT